ncbi:hypothetical protein ILUMI_12095 [Ignelater luminosus]|uniref:Cytochrome P450 n=1 Tax=Ignelater luminosus TaxID=2038154 RepID=A0A8K0D3M3_IGNLU|nr:hypothetical protein ILUMI_12095 [Ignelater luminosus]
MIKFISELFSTQLTNLLLVLLLFLFTIKIYYDLTFQYWKKRNVPQVQKPQLIFGNVPPKFYDQDCPGCLIKLAYEYGKAQGFKLIGNFLGLRPFYLLVDLEHVKNILRKDFNYFVERGFYYNEKDDPLSANLFSVGGEEWRTLRTKLSQAFTAGKIKFMFESLLECAYQMSNEIEKNYIKKQTINMKEISECFTIDVIGSCVFGLQCNSFKNPDAEFRKQGKKIFHFTIPRALKVFFAFSNVKLARWLGVTLFDKDTTRFFVSVVEDTLKYRQCNESTRKDFIQLLSDLKGETEKDNNNSSTAIEKLTAQAFIFFAAGFETSSITLTFCLYELSVNLDIQDKVREEIARVLSDYEEITYDVIMDMKYLNQVVEETLRKYPPVSFLTRECVKDYNVPNTNLVIEEGILTVISVLGIHHDPEYYPEPETFDPERFSDTNRPLIRPFAYMPFGEGPRICVGLRFGLMQVKVGLVVLLKDYKFVLNKKTQVPLEMEPLSFTLTPKNGIFVDIEKVA